MVAEALSARRAVDPPSEGSLPNRILQTIDEAKAVSAADLAQLLGVPRADVEEECERLVRRKVLDKLAEPDLKILKAIDEEERSSSNGGWVATPHVGRTIGMSGRTAYPRCKRLDERLGLLRSDRIKRDRPLFFFPVTGKVLTGANYDDVQKVVRALEAIARRTGLKSGVRIPAALKGRLVTEYRRYFLRLRQGKPNEIRQQIDHFERQLMAVLSGTTLSDVVGFLGIRPFRPWIRVWRLDREGNPTGPVIDAVIGWIVLHQNGGGSLPGPVYIPKRRQRPPNPEAAAAAASRPPDLQKTA